MLATVRLWLVMHIADYDLGSRVVMHLRYERVPRNLGRPALCPLFGVLRILKRTFVKLFKISALAHPSTVDSNSGGPVYIRDGGVSIVTTRVHGLLHLWIAARDI